MELYQRYAARAFYLHYYMVFLYVLPFLGVPYSIISVFFFCLAFLSTYWNKKLLLFQCFSKQKNGNFIFYLNSISEIRKIKNVEYFEILNQRFLLQNKEISVLKHNLDYTLEELNNGITVPNYEFYPNNEFRIPKPEFLKLFKDHCVSPLFSFQIFSILLSSLDGHIYSSLMNAGIVFFVEASLVFSRVLTLKVFTKLQTGDSTVKRIRKGNGNSEDKMVPSSHLKPGDTIEISEILEIPCDMLILSGSCAVDESMLSGESVPLYKEDISELLKISKNKMHKREDEKKASKIHALHKQKKEISEDEEVEEIVDLDTLKPKMLFAGTKLEKVYSSLVCVVLRTSYETEKGTLLSKMLANEEIKYDKEAFKFIILISIISLLNCIATFVYSPKTGYPLLLDLVILFTNSIPFELPMEMGISIQSAVKNLMSSKVYCLEPTKIISAGKVQVACFDKTGTITSSKIEVTEISMGNSSTNDILSVCHNLIKTKDGMKGDPLDIAIYDFITEKVEYKILKQFPFSSELKRQGVLCQIGAKTKFCLKGAPEEIKKYLKEVPSDYDEYLKYSKEGYRVIALAQKELKQQSLAFGDDRGVFESNMEFGGFVLLNTSLRHYANQLTKVLGDAEIKMIMITGDNLLTAMSVAKSIGLNGKGIEGSSITSIIGKSDFQEYCVFGRTSPKDKETIIKEYQRLGLTTMMVGDGTNDVGALKAADVGVAILETVSATPNEQTVIKPSDASMAAPFSVRSDSLTAIIDIINQGRCSLVTTIQMYKILALNSVTSAFFLMATDILGLKFSDAQMAVLGILSSIGFSAISQPTSLKHISKEKPISSIFNSYIFGSIFLQSIVQVICLYIFLKYIRDTEVLITVLLVYSAIQVFCVFTFNYIGRPFRENIVENKILSFSLASILLFALNVILKVLPDINDYIKVVDVSQYTVFILSVSLVMVIGSWLSEKLCTKYLLNKE